LSSTNPDPLPRAPAAQGQAHRRLASILVVDDNRAKATALEAILAPLHQNVVVANSGRDALRALLREDYALILLDVKMPDIDGFETAALIRQRKNSEHTPIIFLTAFDQAELDMARGYSLGAVDFIFTPIVPEILRAKAAVFVELNQKAQEIQELFYAAQDANRFKSEFLNMAAHELRTPLSVVAGYLSMLSEGTLGQTPEAWRLPIDMLNSKTGELNRIVDDLLLASRMDVGALPTVTQRVDLSKSVADAVARAKPRTTLLDGQVRVEVPRRPVLAEFDPDHLARILDNLVNNALTYCRTSPKVTVRVVAADSPRIEVEDNGVGIPPGKEEAIFDQFVRLDEPSLGPIPGTGLGLYISRQLAERQGGRLVLERSEPGKGSLFTLVVPAAPGVDGHGRAAAPETAAGEGGETMRPYIVNGT